MKILCIPHIGTAYGHLFRMQQVLQIEYGDYEVEWAISKNHKNFIEKYLPSSSVVHYLDSHFSFTNEQGVIQKAQYLEWLNDLEKLIQLNKYELIVGDPGISASVVSLKTGIPWVGIMHGGYLDLNTKLLEQKGNWSVTNQLVIFAWSKAQKVLNTLINAGTNSVYTEWLDILETGRVLVPNVQDREPFSRLVEYVPYQNLQNKYWKDESERRFLITIKSSGSLGPSESLLRKIVSYYGECTICGPVKKQHYIQGVEYLNASSFSSLVGESTTVICHGGHGTLQTVVNAREVIIVPCDLDQLINSFIFERTVGAHVYLDQQLLNDLNGEKVLYRYDTLANSNFDEYFENIINALEREPCSKVA